MTLLTITDLSVASELIQTAKIGDRVTFVVSGIVGAMSSELLDVTGFEAGSPRMVGSSPIVDIIIDQVHRHG